MRSLHQQEVVQRLVKVYEALRVNFRALRQDSQARVYIERPVAP